MKGCTNNYVSPITTAILLQQNHAKDYVGVSNDAQEKVQHTALYTLRQCEYLCIFNIKGSMDTTYVNLYFQFKNECILN